jgi:ribosome-associated toxin RatA of RatAB toxin-antitoxin module
MALTEFHEVFDVNSERLMSVITQYEGYPLFLEGCHSVKVDRTCPDTTKTRVTYSVHLLSKEIGYTLDHVQSVTKGSKKAHVVQWELVESGFFKKNSGQWIVVPKGKSRSEVTYRLEIEFIVPVPGFILNRLIQGNLKSMIQSFIKRAEGSG